MVIHRINGNLVLIAKNGKEAEYSYNTIQSMIFDGITDGFCTNCGSIVDSVETDARNYFCEDCQTSNVQSVIELLMVSF
ncbi:hypothetical protein M0R19_03595 [Candidatus Pacearchaeota archaeon]|jgi:formamidopyrimidine-DNA glycosylase|nr:hypothetical protein [Candidatus Pacearchaeota archaeon]